MKKNIFNKILVFVTPVFTQKHFGGSSENLESFFLYKKRKKNETLLNKKVFVGC